MIYIDPPYNTGHDFLYKDDFSQKTDEYTSNSGQYDEQGNRLVQNTESNGRFHTDWLNMIYPRLRLAKDLLSDDGVIFISIDDNEIENLKKLCSEIFGESNFVAIINWKGRGGRQDSKYYAAVHEYILVYAKNISFFSAGEEIKNDDVYPKYDKEKQRFYKTQLLRKWGSNSRREDRPNLFYPIKAPDGTDVYPMLNNEAYCDQNSKNFGCWRHGVSTMKKNIEEGRVEFIKQNNGTWIPYEKIFAPLEGEEKTKKYTTWIDETNDGASVIKSFFNTAVFDYPKSPSLLVRFMKMVELEEDDIILDFFSGSATTAHAVMKLNAEDGGHRKFIMVQIPEKCDEKSEAYKAGYKNICEIGKERIRRAGKQILDEMKNKKEDLFSDEVSLDIGFRDLKLDSSNMNDVYYTPEETDQRMLNGLESNIKADRSAEDLLFQVMLDLGVLLSAKIVEETISGKKIFNVDDNYLIACFDEDVDEAVIMEVANKKPTYFVMRDSSLANDSVSVNFDQIFMRYSPDTVRKVL